VLFSFNRHYARIMRGGWKKTELPFKMMCERAAFGGSPPHGGGE